MKRKDLLFYGTLGLITAPIWVPLAIATYIGGHLGYKALQVSFRHPKKTAAGLAFVGLASYVSCNHGDSLKKAATYAIEQKIRSKYEISEPRSLEQVVDTSYESQRPVTSETGYNFYYVKQGDTLSSIAERVSGESEVYHIIANDNHILEPKDLLTGQLLRIRQELCTNEVQDVYTKVPNLNSISVPGNKRISDIFPANFREVLALNRTLGLDYDDAFPYENGARIVHYNE